MSAQRDRALAGGSLLLLFTSDESVAAHKRSQAGQGIHDMELENRMNGEVTRKAVATKARALLANCRFTGALLRDIGEIGEPIPVTGPDGNVQSWLAPVLVCNLLAGFFRTDPWLSDWNWIGFQRRDDSLEGCPKAEIWLDVSWIRRRAEMLAQPGEVAMEPVLSYDRIPDRVAWAVRLISEDGAERTIFVAGYVAWPAALGPVDSTDGN